MVIQSGDFLTAGIYSTAKWEGFVIGNSERLNGEKNGRMPHFFSPFRVQTTPRGRRQTSA